MSDTLFLDDAKSRVQELAKLLMPEIKERLAAAVECHPDEIDLDWDIVEEVLTEAAWEHMQRLPEFDHDLREAEYSRRADERHGMRVSA